MLKQVVAGLIVLASVSACPVFATPEFDQAVKLYNAKNYPAAKQVFAKIISGPNPGPTPIYYAGLCYQQMGDMAMAKWCYEILNSHYANSPESKLGQTALDRMKNVTSAAIGAVSPPKKIVPETSGPRGAVSVTEFLRNYSMSDAEWKTMPDEVKIPFKRATSSHLFLNGSVNGRSLAMMFDTGAEQCHFSRQQLESLGIKVEHNGVKIPVQGIAGMSYSEMIMADIAIGDLRRRIPVLVDDAPLGMPIVGETFFKEFRYDIDNAGGFIKFSKKPRAGMASHSYESTDVIAVPYKNMGDNMVVMAKVNGMQFPMIFDTGSFAICFSMPQAASLGIRIPSDAKVMATAGAGGTVRAYEFTIDRIELGSIIKTSVPIVVNESSSPPLPLLGQPFYKDRRFSVDTEKHLIKFAH